MTCVKKISITTLVVLFFSCNWKVPESREGMIDEIIAADSLAADPGLHVFKKDSIKKDESPHSNTGPINTIVLPPSTEIDVRDVSPVKLVDFAETLAGTPYVYGSINPAVGFDCSGFITYVFNHFDIRVPGLPLILQTLVEKFAKKKLSVVILFYLPVLTRWNAM
jgi:hypothetical protein